MSSSTALSNPFLRGQTTVEYLLIFTILLAFLQFSVQPAVDISSQTALDVKHVSGARLAATQLAQAINEVGTSPSEAVRTIDILLPSDRKDLGQGIDVQLYCDDTAAGKEIFYQVSLYSTPPVNSVLATRCADLSPTQKHICRGSVPILPELDAPIDNGGGCNPSIGDPLNGDISPRSTWQIRKNAGGEIVINQI